MNAIPGPDPRPDGGVGAIAQAGGLHAYQLRLHAEYGPVVRFQLPGAETAVSIADPVLLEATAHLNERPERLFSFLDPLFEAGNLQVLPADLATFTGRGRELAVLVGEFGRGAAVVSTIEGPAGIGKTRLALHAAHRLVRDGRCADVQLYVNLRGCDPEHPPADPVAVLGMFLRQLEVPAKHVPTGAAERAALFRGRMHGKQAVAALDDAACDDPRPGNTRRASTAR